MRAQCGNKTSIINAFHFQSFCNIGLYQTVQDSGRYCFLCVVKDIVVVMIRRMFALHCIGLIENIVVWRAVRCVVVVVFVVSRCGWCFLVGHSCARGFFVPVHFSFCVKLVEKESK